jgi:protein disulfide-isomerase
MNTQNHTSPEAELSPLPVRLFRAVVVAAALTAFGASMGFCEEPVTKTSAPKIQKNTWVSTWAEAVEASKATGKPIMLMFTGSDWCLWCQKLENEVFQRRGFHQWSDRVIKIRIDFPEGHELPAQVKAQNEVLKNWYGDFVESYPTCLFVEPTGRVIGTTGYVEGGPDFWIDRAEGVLLNFGDLSAQADFSKFAK